MIMPPSPQHTPCEEHSRHLAEHDARLAKGDAILTTVKRIETAVCGDPDMGIEGLATLPKRVQALERRQWWMLGGVAALSTGIPLVLQMLGK